MRHTEMRTILTLINIFIFALTCNGQNFTLLDTTFRSGDILVRYDIVFDYNDALIKPDNYALLDSIAEFLIKHANLTIEVGIHCDERFSAVYSTCLTCARAKAIADYLSSKGIKSEKVIAKGYNDTKPIIVDAKTEDEHQKNRRTEFKILRTDYFE
jgi:peptidoglycan-associated lipoprotein